MRICNSDKNGRLDLGHRLQDITLWGINSKKIINTIRQRTRENCDEDIKQKWKC